MGSRPKAVFILAPENYTLCYSKDDRDTIHELLDVIPGPHTPETVRKHPDILREVEVIMSAWGAPHIDEQFLLTAPELKAVFYAAGSIRGIVSDGFWKRNITICSAWGANGIPVAEYTLSQILWALKLGHHYARLTRSGGWASHLLQPPGAYGSNVGIISLGMIGRHVCRMLEPFDLKVLAYDPFISEDKARQLGAELVDLDELFRKSAVVSLHTPNLPETQGMIKGRHFELMPEYSTFINTARGAVINEPEMIKALQQRPDIQAVLDVTNPEPPAPGSPLYSMDNVLLTPHIAGSMNNECHRMGSYMLQELKRFLKKEPLQWQVTRDMADRMA